MNMQYEVQTAQLNRLVQYLTKQRRKNGSGTGRHHLLDWCNAITSQRSRTLPVHSSPLKHNDRITTYTLCYISV